MFVNRATLIGFPGKNAELRHTRNEMPFAVLSLATKRSWKNCETDEYESERRGIAALSAALALISRLR
jgi:single-stranded DNA-binding protein